MPYIGTSPSNGVRRVHTYTATASQTTFTGASSEGVTLSYADTNYIDVFQNGVLLGSADYTSTSGTSVVLAQGASADDLIVIVVYDVFSVADTVSKTNGGTFDNGITIDEDGATVLTVDRATSDGNIIDLQKDGTTVGSISSSGGGVHYNGVGLGLRMSGTAITPSNGGTGVEDATNDLGTNSARFKDLYLSGGAYIGGTGSANKLDDFEEGSWTPAFRNDGSTTYSVQYGRYVKIGSLVMASVYLNVSSNNIGTNAIQIETLPFTSTNDDANAYGSSSSLHCNSWSTSVKPDHFIISANSTFATGYGSVGQAGITFPNGNDLGTGNLIVTLIYRTDS